LIKNIKKITQKFFSWYKKAKLRHKKREGHTHMLKYTGETKYERLVREFGLLVFNEEVFAAINTFKEEKEKIENEKDANIEKELAELDKDLQLYIEKGATAEQAYTLLGINKKERDDQKYAIRKKFYEKQVEKINEAKTTLRNAIKTKPEFAKVTAELEWFENDYEFLKVFTKKFADFFVKIEKDQKKPELKKEEDKNEEPAEKEISLNYHYELLFDVLYFSMEDSFARARFTKAAVQFDVLNELLGPNDELFEDLVTIVNKSRDDAKDEKGNYVREKDWFASFVIDVN